MSFGGGGGTGANQARFVFKGKTPVKPPISPTFMAYPGSPRAMRIITMSRSVAMDGKRGSARGAVPWEQREAMTSDTMSAFAPMYQHFVQEFQGFKGFNDAQINAVIAILEKPRTHDSGLIGELEDACRKHSSNKNPDDPIPSIADALYNVLLPQYSRGQSGVVNGLLSLSNADILQRFNALGFGTQLRAEMLQVLNNSQFFKNISVDVNETDKTIKIMKNGKALVEGKVEDEKKTVTLKISTNVAPEDRDDAIKHLLMFAASHAQQNNSNVFRPSFGDNIYENIRMLQLAIGVHNLRIPEECIKSQYEKLEGKLGAITDPSERKIAEKALKKWSDRAETFSAKVTVSGTKTIDNNHRENNMSLANTQKTFLSEVTESIFPGHASTLKRGHP